MFGGIGTSPSLDTLEQNRSAVNRSTLSRRGSNTSVNSMSVSKLSKTMKFQKTILIKDGTIKKRDVELDWRDRLKTWKQR